MTNTCTLQPLPTAEDLAAALQKKFAGGIAKLSSWAGWTRDDASQQCWVAAAEAIENFKPDRGEIMPRAWWLLRKAAVRSGLLPRAQRRAGDEANDEDMVGLDCIVGGDDPAAILAARQRVGAVLALGVGQAPARGGKRQQRRQVAAARGAAEALLRGDVAQGELFGLEAA